MFIERGLVQTPLEDAVVERLKADINVFVYGKHTAATKRLAYPYVELAGLSSASRDTNNSFGDETLVTVRHVTRHKTGLGTDREIYRLASKTNRSMFKAALVLPADPDDPSGQHNFVGITRDDTFSEEVIRQRTDQYEIRIFLTRYRITTQYIPN